MRWCQMASRVVLMARLTGRALSLDFLAPAFPGELVGVLFRERVGGNRSACPDTRIRPSFTLVLTGPSGRIGGFFGVTAFY